VFVQHSTRLTPLNLTILPSELNRRKQGMLTVYNVKHTREYSDVRLCTNMLEFR